MSISIAPHRSSAGDDDRLDALAVAWRQAREHSTAAYRGWRDARHEDRRLAYAVFLAAADRESAAERAFLDEIDVVSRPPQS
jgi:hypothetical protein